MISRSSLLGRLALVFMLMFSGCKPATTQATTIESPKPTLSPAPLETTDTVEVQTPAPNATPTPTQVLTPTPIPIPEMPLVIDAAHADVVAITDVISQPDSLLENGRTFTVQALKTSPLPETLSVHVLSNSEDIRVYRSEESDAALHKSWNKVSVQVERGPGESTAKVTIQSVKPGRHLVAGRETTTIPTSIEYKTSPIVDAKSVESSDFPNDATVAAAYTAQEYAGTPYYSSVYIPSEKILKGEKTVVVFVHGVGSERYEAEQYLWRAYLLSVASGASFTEFKRRFIVMLYRYDSSRPIDTNADGLIAAVSAKYGTRNVILVGHSMGGLICRLAYAKKFSSGDYRGVITLGTPHLGSPLACPKLMANAFASQPYETLLTVIHKLAMNNLFNAIKSLTIKKRVSDFVSPIAPQYNEGILSLATHEKHFGIPSGLFMEHLSIGGPLTIPIPVIIDQTDERVLKASSSTLYSLFTGAVGVRQENGVPMVNQIELLETYERSVGCDTVPHVTPYGATIGGSDVLRAANVLFNKAATADGIKAIVADSSRELQQQFLRWLAGPVNAMIPTASGRKSLCSDGLVRLEDALGLTDGDPIATLSSDGLPQVNMTVVQKRKSPWVKSMRYFPQYTHLDLAIGRIADNAAYFDSITSDLIAYDDEAQASRITTLSSADVTAIEALIRPDFTGGPAWWSAMLVAARGGPGRATVSLRTHLTINDVGYYQYYYVYVQKLANTWRYQVAKQYDENGRITTLQPLPQP